MKPLKPTFGERITELEFLMGSQKKLAKSFGVSTRTIRRWKDREDPPNAGQTRGKELRTLTRRRERYWKEEKPKKRQRGPVEIGPDGEPLPDQRLPLPIPGRGVLRLNDYLRDGPPIERAFFAFDLEGWLQTGQGRAFKDALTDDKPRGVEVLVQVREAGEPRPDPIRRVIAYEGDVPTFVSDFYALQRSLYDEAGPGTSLFLL